MHIIFFLFYSHHDVVFSDSTTSCSPTPSSPSRPLSKSQPLRTQEQLDSPECEFFENGDSNCVRNSQYHLGGVDPNDLSKWLVNFCFENFKLFF